MFKIYTEKVLIYSNPRIHKFDMDIQKGLGGENSSWEIIKALKKWNSISPLTRILQKDKNAFINIKLPLQTHLQHYYAYTLPTDSHTTWACVVLHNHHLKCSETWGSFAKTQAFLSLGNRLGFLTPGRLVAAAPEQYDSGT